MTASGRTVAVGVFPDRREAEHALDELRREGFDDNQIGMVVRDSAHPGGIVRADEGDSESRAAAGAASGAALGGILGALATGLIPGIGLVLAGGLLAGILGGAAVGAMAGGLIGALTEMGVPEDEARYYDEEFRGGATLVTVSAGARYDEALEILRDHGGYDVQERRGTDAGSLHRRASTSTDRPASNVD
jgi:uncharacterized membrane protein